MLAPCYLIHGGELLQTEKIIASIKEQAAQHDYNNYVVFTVTAHFDWEQLLNKCQNLDLFAEKTLIEVRLEKDTLNKQGNEILTSVLQQQDSNVCFIIRAGRLKPQILNTSWVNQIRKTGTVHFTKPNAISQPSVFDLTNAALKGDQSLIIKILNTLKETNAEPILILWGITREVRQLLQAKYSNQQDKPFQRQALSRLSTEKLEELLLYSNKIDQIIKGITPGEVWGPLLSICLSLASQNPLPLEEIAI